MDLVKIGFQINANGLKDANKQVDDLLSKVDKIGTQGKKSAADFETSQKKVKESSKEAAKEVDKTSKALEKQKIIGEYLGKGLDKTTATSIANFKQLGASVSQTDALMSTLSNNKGLLQTQKDIVALTKAQEQHRKVVEQTIDKYESLSRSPFGNGILDNLGKQDKALKSLNTQYAEMEKQQQKSAKLVQDTVDKYDQMSRKSFGGGILDNLDQQQKALKDLNNEYRKIEQEQEAARQKRFSAEQKDYQLRMEMAEKERSVLNKKHGVLLGGGTAQENSLPSLIALQKAADGARKSNSSLLASIKGIAAYALLSTAIYGVITALANLAVNFVETADEMTNLTQRLGIYLPANIKVNQVLERMGEIAKENRVTLADTGKLFTQLLPPVQRIKGGVAETTAIVDAFGKAMLIGGANTKEAASATIQFGQAMASGKLAGDEFRSLAEASPRLLQAIADGAGIAAQKLKEMSAAGKLTSGLVSAALLDQFIQLEYEALKMGQTVSGAFNEGMVSYQMFVDKFNKQTGFTDSVVQSIRDMVKFLEGIGNSFLKSLEDSNSTLNSFLSLLKTVWDLVGSLVSGFTDVVGWIVKGGEKTGLWKTIFDSVKMAIITIVDVLAKIPFAIVNIGVTIADKVLTPFRKFIELAQKGLDMAGFAGAAAKLGEGLAGYKENVTAIKSITGEVVSGFNLLSLGVKKTEDSTGNINNLLESLKTQNSNLVIQEKEKKAMTDQQYINEYAKLLLQKEGIDANKQNLDLVKKELEERFKITQQQAKDLKLQGEIQAKKDEAEAKAKKAAEERKREAEQERKRLQSIRDNYEEQINYVYRLQGLLGAGEKTAVARIAAEKDYADAISGTYTATRVAEAERQLSMTNYNMSLEEEANILAEIEKFQDRGATYSQARALAQAGYLSDELGLLALEYQMVNEFKDKLRVVQDQARTQKDINYFLGQGLSIEEATTRAAFARLSFISNGLSKERQALRDKTIEQEKLKKSREVEAGYLQDLTKSEAQRIAYVNAQAEGYEKLAFNMAVANKIAQNPDLSPTQAKKLVEAEELTSYEKEIANLKAKTYLTTLKESDAVKDIISNYATWDSVQVGAYDRQQKLLGIAKDLSDEAERQRKNPLGDFSSVDFNVFGDFGNPFEAALAGLNEFVAKSTESRNILASIEKDIVAAKEKGLSVTDLEFERNLVLAGQEKDRKESINKGITTSLALTKSLFKEESKGYKIISGLEKAYQASQIAFKLWEKKEEITLLALKLKAHITDALGFTTGAAAKLAAQSAVNVAKGTEAVLSQGSGDPYTAFARMAAMAAIVAGLGVAVGAIGGGSGSAPTPSNDGTGTVFGDSTAQSESIKKSIDLLADNSDLMLPINNAMLRALKNIESALGGVANLIIRGDIGNSFASGLEFDGKITGVLGSLTSTFVKFTNKLEGIGLTNFGLGTSIVSSIIGGLFGKTSQSVTGSGLFAGSQSLGSVLDTGLNLQQYADVATTKKSWFSKSTSYSTQYGAVDQEIKNQFGLIFDGVFNSILTASSALGRDGNEVTQALRNSIINIGKIDTKGLSGEEIQKKLEAVISAQADTVAKNAVKGLDAFQKIGEGYFETLTRVATGIEQAAYFTDRLGYTSIQYADILYKQGDVAAEIVRQSVLLNESTKGITGGFYDMVNQFDGTAEELYSFIIELRDLQDQLFMTGKDAKYLTTAMVLGAGGLDALSSGFDAYFEMLSPAEQAAELTRRLTNEFALFGKQLPSDVKAYRDLVNSIDVSTEAGQKLYGQILALAPEFNDLQDSLKSANSEVNALVKSLRDLAEEARKARGETQQPSNLAYVRSQFQNDSILAMQGDTDAANRLLTLGKDLMSLSKQYSVSGSEYAKDLALIQRAATVSADVQEAGLGYTPSTTLSTALVSGNTASVVQALEQKNATLEAEIKSMREDTNAGLLAIAKFTQNMDSRFERWDDGNRMIVGIASEQGDTPVAVAVVP